MTALAHTASLSPELAARESQAALRGASDLWMIDHCGSTVLSCRCLESSADIMRLRIPLGYGVTRGQRYELWPHPHGAGPQTPSGPMDRRWATVVRMQPCADQADDHVEISVALDPGGPRSERNAENLAFPATCNVAL